MKFGQITSNLRVEQNNDLNCIEVINIRRDFRFLLDYEDEWILDYYQYFSEKKREIGNGSNYIEAYKNQKEISISKLIMKKEIKEYIQKYNKEPIVVRINKSNDPYDYRKSNLQLTSKRMVNPKFKDSASTSRYIGVKETSSGTFQMSITDPNTKTVIYKYYSTPEIAALMYDYFANKFYPSLNDGITLWSTLNTYA